MTIITLLGSDKMAIRLAGCCRAIMAGVTVIRHTRMIKGHTGPVGGGGMAVITLCIGRQMPGRLTRCEVAVVAIGTGASHIGVVETHTQPVACR